MTQEEKLELIKALAQNGKTEIVFEKNVEYEIGNVEAGGIGVQINNGVTTASKKDGRKTSESAARIVDDVFTYCFLEEDDARLRLAKLYQILIKAKWIDKQVQPGDFCALFEGVAKPVKVKWLGSQSELYLMIKLLIDRRLIKCPKSIGKWVITGSHFVDKQSRPFNDWNSQKEPKKSAPAIERMVDILDPTKPLEV